MEFSGQSFEGQIFQGIAASAKDLTRKEFTGCAFRNCDLSDGKLPGSLFVNCSFVDCNLSNIRIDGCSFRNVLFDGCKLVGVAFSAVNPFLLDWSFKRCKIELCDFNAIKMKRTLLIDCIIRGTDFIKADLSDADFSGSDLSGSKFQHTVLERANFTGAYHYYIDPMHNRVKQAKFSYPEVLSLLTPFQIEVE